MRRLEIFNRSVDRLDASGKVRSSLEKEFGPLDESFEPSARAWDGTESFEDVRRCRDDPADNRGA